MLSILDSPHNLHAYEEAGMPYAHVPLGRHDEWPERLPVLYGTLQLVAGHPAERVLIHHEEFGDRLLGVLAGYLLYAGLVTEGPHAVVVIETHHRASARRNRARGRRRDGRGADPGTLDRGPCAELNARWARS